MALCAKNYGSFQLKVPQTLIVGTSFSGSGNVILWERERHSLGAGTSNAGSVYGVQCFLTLESCLLKDFHAL